MNSKITLGRCPSCLLGYLVEVDPARLICPECSAQFDFKTIYEALLEQPELEEVIETVTTTYRYTSATPEEIADTVQHSVEVVNYILEKCNYL